MGKPDHKCHLLEGRERRETKGEGDEILYGLGAPFSLPYQAVIYWASPLVAPMIKNPPAVQETWARSLG